MSNLRARHRRLSTAQEGTDHAGNGPSPHRVETDAGWEALEQMPAPLRAAIYDAARPMDPQEFLRFFRRQTDLRQCPVLAPRVSVAKLRALEDAERVKFAAAFRVRFGFDYPHFAAGGTVQRYGRDLLVEDPQPASEPDSHSNGKNGVSQAITSRPGSAPARTEPAATPKLASAPR